MRPPSAVHNGQGSLESSVEFECGMDIVIGEICTYSYSSSYGLAWFLQTNCGGLFSLFYGFYH